jgi:hypothetical protein
VSLYLLRVEIHYRFLTDEFVWVLTGKSDVKKQLERPYCTGKDNIKISLNNRG